MAATVIGNGLTTALTRKDSPRIRVTPQGTDYIYRKTVKCGVTLTLAFGDANPDAAYSTTVLKEINHDPTPGGGYETLELVYGTPVPGNPMTPPVGTIIFEADANPIEIPIEQHPNFSPGQSQYDDAGNIVTPYVNGLKPGVTSYQVPQPTFTRTEILSSFTFSEANIISNVGKRNAPTGMTSPTANKWLKTRLSLRQSGNVVEKTESWQYAGNGWDTDIYS